MGDKITQKLRRSIINSLPSVLTDENEVRSYKSFTGYNHKNFQKKHYLWGSNPKMFFMIKRDLYLKQLIKFIDKPFVKVLAGLRRSGKSSLLILLKEELLDRGIDNKNIIYINLESFEFNEIRTADKLYRYIETIIQNNSIPGNNRYYILLDEIQEVDSWEKAVNSFMVDFNCDLYLTGSNSRLLSSELATYLTGRYVEFHIHPLSFGESILFRKEYDTRADNGIYREFEYYLRFGGFPVLHTGVYDSDTAYKVVYDIYSSIILRDTIQKNNIRDVELLERVVKFVFDNIGNKFSAKNVADYFKSQQRKIDLNTVYNYLNALEGAFVVYRIPRYDVKGKEILKTQEKYFVGDQAFLYAVAGYNDSLIAGVLENIVMLELLRKGYKVYSGKSEEYEIDFVALSKQTKIYIQVSYRLDNPSTVEREFRPLLALKDHYHKYVVTMDELRRDEIEGVKHIHIADFLLMSEY